MPIGPGPDLSDWIGVNGVRALGNTSPSGAYRILATHNIAKQKMFGLMRYYKPDVEKALALEGRLVEKSVPPQPDTSVSPAVDTQIGR